MKHFILISFTLLIVLCIGSCLNIQSRCNELSKQSRGLDSLSWCLNKMKLGEKIDSFYPPKDQWDSCEAYNPYDNSDSGMFYYPKN